MAASTAADEYLPEEVTTIGNSFRQYQYSGCSSLVQAAVEALPASVTTIDTYFRVSQYQNCAKLDNPDNNSLISIRTVGGTGSNYRANQYAGTKKNNSTNKVNYTDHTPVTEGNGNIPASFYTD